MQSGRHCELHDVERGRISRFLNSYGQRARQFGARNRKVQKNAPKLDQKLQKSCKNTQMLPQGSKAALPCGIPHLWVRILTKLHPFGQVERNSARVPEFTENSAFFVVNSETREEFREIWPSATSLHNF